MSGDGQYWCPACLNNVDVARDSDGRRVFADHNDPESGQLCAVSGMRNGWDER